VNWRKVIINAKTLSESEVITQVIIYNREGVNRALNKYIVLQGGPGEKSLI